MDNLLNFQAIEKAEDSKTEAFPIPEWGGSLLLRVMPGDVRDGYESLAARQTRKDEANTKGLKVELISRCVVTKESQTYLHTDQAKKMLQSKSGAVLHRIFMKCAEMNGIGQEAIKEMEKNLQGDQSTGSGSN